MRRFSFGVVVLAVAGLSFGCKGKEGDDSKPADTPPQEAKAADDQKPADAKEPKEGEPAKGDEKLKSHMKGHFAAVRGIQDAIVQGSLDSAKQQSTAFASHEAHSDIAEWQSYIESMRGAATAVGNSKELAEAAGHVAKLNGECASCHQAMTAIVTFEFVEKPDMSDKDAKAHMAMHKWGVERLWEGLVGPSDSHWTLGAEALEMDPVTKSKEPKGVAELAAQVHTIATKAKSATEPEERAVLFGELLSTCSTCHSMTRNK